MIMKYDKKGLIDKALNDPEFSEAIDSENIDNIAKALHDFVLDKLSINNMYLKCCIIFDFLRQNDIDLFKSSDYIHDNYWNTYMDIFPDSVEDLEFQISGVTQI